MVGASGFEPPASWSRTRRASQAALRPDDTHSGASKKRPEWNIQNSIAHGPILERALQDLNTCVIPRPTVRTTGEVQECRPQIRIWRGRG